VGGAPRERLAGGLGGCGLLERACMGAVHYIVARDPAERGAASRAAARQCGAGARPCAPSWLPQLALALPTIGVRAQDESLLMSLVQRHLKYTGSTVARGLLNNWSMARAAFVKVFPVEYRRALEQQAAERARPRPRVPARPGGVLLARGLCGQANRQTWQGVRHQYGNCAERVGRMQLRPVVAALRHVRHARKAE